MMQLRRRSCDGRKVKIQYLKYYSEISVIGGRGQMLHPISVNSLIDWIKNNYILGEHTLENEV